MSSMQRNKGARIEREFAARLTEDLGVTYSRRSLIQSQGTGLCADIETGGDRYWFEVKGGARVNHRAALRQATRDALENGNSRLPIVLARDDREEPVVFMSYETFVKLIRQ
jgi:predicted RecB family endonuclease